MSIEQHMPGAFAGMPAMTSTDTLGDLTTQRFIYDTLTAQAGPANPPNDTDQRQNVDGTSSGVDHFNDTQTVDPRKVAQGPIEDRYTGLSGTTADDVAALLRQELRSYMGMPVRLEIPTVISTVRMYVPAPVSSVAAAPTQLLSVDTNRYRILLDAYADGAGTFRLFLGQTASDAISGSGFRFDSTQAHPIQIHWGSDLYVGADPANAVGGYVNVIVERFR